MDKDTGVWDILSSLLTEKCRKCTNKSVFGFVKVYDTDSYLFKRCNC